jgi:hypothetical protein
VKELLTRWEALDRAAPVTNDTGAARGSFGFDGRTYDYADIADDPHLDYDLSDRLRLRIEGRGWECDEWIANVRIDPYRAEVRDASGLVVVGRGSSPAVALLTAYLAHYDGAATA